jgi:hypothetical protein
MRLDVIGGAPASSNPAAYVLAAAESNLRGASIAAAIEILLRGRKRGPPGRFNLFADVAGCGALIAVGAWSMHARKVAGGSGGAAGRGCRRKEKCVGGE